MKRIAIVFLVAVIGPSLVLAWLATRSLRDQQLVLERQETIIAEGIAEKLSAELSAAVRQHQGELAAAVEELLNPGDPENLAWRFDPDLREKWKLAEVGFAVALRGEVISPWPSAGRAQLKFRIQNDPFLSSTESMEVIWKGPKGPVNLSELEVEKSGERIRPPLSCVFITKSATNGAGQSLTNNGQFREIISDSREGTLARFVQDELNLLFWYRSPRASNFVFGAKVDLPALARSLEPLVRLTPPWDRQFVAALRDDLGRPAALSQPNFTSNWKRPVAGIEVGELLPHWVVALYPLHPGQSLQTATTLRWTIGLLIAVLMLAIGIGGWLVTAEVQGEMKLARQKTDFVSNVSHELKTPLTSIRLFAEMLTDKPGLDSESRRRFLGVIHSESTRLTRLINNVLDFSRLDRSPTAVPTERVDLVELVREGGESCRPGLEKAGLELRMELPPDPVWADGERDGLSRVVLNLLSNAEKYSATGKEVTCRLSSGQAWAVLECLDRGPGVPPGLEEKVFEQFFRAHDSLASGVGGCGLGLTLARKIVEDHRGRIDCCARIGGGACFTVRLPLTACAAPK